MLRTIPLILLLVLATLPTLPTITPKSVKHLPLPAPVPHNPPLATIGPVNKTLYFRVDMNMSEDAWNTRPQTRGAIFMFLMNYSANITQPPDDFLVRVSCHYIPLPNETLQNFTVYANTTASGWDIYSYNNVNQTTTKVGMVIFVLYPPILANLTLSRLYYRVYANATYVPPGVGGEDQTINANYNIWTGDVSGEGRINMTQTTLAIGLAMNPSVSVANYSLVTSDPAQYPLDLDGNGEQDYHYDQLYDCYRPMYRGLEFNLTSDETKIGMNPNKYNVNILGLITISVSTGYPTQAIPNQTIPKMFRGNPLMNNGTGGYFRVPAGQFLVVPLTVSFANFSTYILISGNGGLAGGYLNIESWPEPQLLGCPNPDDPQARLEWIRNHWMNWTVWMFFGASYPAGIMLECLNHLNMTGLWTLDVNGTDRDVFLLNAPPEYRKFYLLTELIDAFGIYDIANVSYRIWNASGDVAAGILEHVNGTFWDAIHRFGAWVPFNESWAEGEYNVTVTITDIHGYSLNYTKTIRLVRAPSYTLDLQAVDWGGYPLANATISITANVTYDSSFILVHYSGITDANGNLHLTEVLGGDLWINVTFCNFVVNQTTYTLSSNSSLTLKCMVSPITTRTVLIEDPSKRFPGILVTWNCTSALGALTITNVTDADGELWLQLPWATYTVNASYLGVEVARISDVVVNASSPSGWLLQVPCRIYNPIIKVTTRGLAPLLDANVSLSYAGIFVRGATNASGAFNASWLPEATYHIFVSYLFAPQNRYFTNTTDILINASRTYQIVLDACWLNVTVRWNNGTLIEGASVTIKQGAAIVEEGSSGPDGGYRTMLFSGTYTVSAIFQDREVSRTVDLFSDTALELVFTTEVDTEAPSIYFIKPYKRFFNQQWMVIRWNATDNVGIDHFDIYLNNEYVDTVRAEGATSGSWEYNFTTDLSEGNYTVRVEAFDQAGNRGENATWFVIDLTPPQVTITKPENGTTYAPGWIEVRWNASDNYGIDHFDIYLNDKYYDTLNGEAGRYLFEDLPEGVYTAKVVATDLAGNTGYSIATFTLEVGAPPAVTTYTLTVTVQWENGTPIEGAAVKVYVPGAASPVKEGTTDSSGRWTTELPEGDYVVIATYADYSSESKQVTLNQDLSITLTITPPTQQPTSQPVTEEEEAAGVPWLFIGAGIAVAVALAAAFLFLRRRRQAPE